MKALLRGYGAGLVALFFGAVAIWGLLLILLPQVTMLERALTKPKRTLDSSIAATLARDAETCISVLERYQPSDTAPASSGGIGVPSIGGIGIPSMGGAAQGSRPYVLQCDRADTHVALSRDGETRAWLDETYDLPRMRVSDTVPLADQIAQARGIADLAAPLSARLVEEEARSSALGLSNFSALVQPVLIPLSDTARASEDAKLSNILLGVTGLRFEKDGQIYQRIGLITLTRTLSFAVMATALALVLCYPIAYKVALATPPEWAVWLFLGLIIPYAVVELMRVYAWTAIIDNRGLINEALLWLGAISEPIQFKRSALTVFVVIVYTYVLFMVFPIYNVMTTLDRNQIEAAEDLGASTWRVHRRVVIPHAKPGIAVGCIATFMLSAGAFSVPRIISRGLQSEWFAQTIYNKFFESENSNVGAAYSFAYTLVCFLMVAIFMRVVGARLKDFARVQ
ncbi:MAG: ABC transporter permease [Rhodobacteraceae bacterium]|nr:ABC transporter permease [Paracoccaceae bacterium]